VGNEFSYAHRKTRNNREPKSLISFFRIDGAPGAASEEKGDLRNRTSLGAALVVAVGAMTGIAFLFTLPVKMLIAPRKTLTMIMKIETAAGMSENSMEAPTKTLPTFPSWTSDAPIYPAAKRNVERV
jgi:hypothetical protein